MFAATLLPAVLLAPPEPAPPPPATLVGHTTLTSEDGKHTARLLTVGFPFDDRGRAVLRAVMNSDGYWDHFRHWFVYLRAGGKVFASGPRLATGDPWGFRRKPDDPPPKYEWTVSFALPGDVKLTGVELEFCHYRVRDGGKSEPDEQPFATLKLTEKELKAVARPLRATVKETGRMPDPSGGKGDVHSVLFSLNHLPRVAEYRVGEAKPRGFARYVSLGEGKGYRYQAQDEVILAFTEPPPAGAPVWLRFHDLPGWYQAETVAEKPKDKK